MMSLNLDKLKRRIKQVNAFHSLMILILGCILSLFLIINFKQSALALVQGRYDRLAGDDAATMVNDWNVLDEDFLLTDGSSQMDGTLDMVNNTINNILSNPADNTSVANVGYVDSLLSTAQGGDVYTNWGRDDCGANTVLYSGYGFSSLYAMNSGGDNPICMQAPADYGGANNNTINVDKLYPLMPGTQPFLPDPALDSSSITAQRFMKCAVCYRFNSSCYLNISSDTCPLPLFSNRAYDGYMLGAVNANTQNMSNERLCVNRNFDIGASGSTGWGSTLYGTRIREDFGVGGYSLNNFIKCSVCCK